MSLHVRTLRRTFVKTHDVERKLFYIFCFCSHLVEEFCSNFSSVILQPVGKLDDHAVADSSHCL